MKPSAPDEQDYFAAGTALLAAGKAAEALPRLVQALAEQPDNPLYLLYTGAALHDCGRYTEAIVCYDHALELVPQYGEAHNNRGNSLLALQHFTGAIEAFAAAAANLPDSPVPLAALATALQAVGKIPEAETCCRRALQLDPEFPEAHWNLALNLLLQGRYRDGWSEYEWRWRRPAFTSPRRYPEQLQWDGTPLHGRTILLHAEQGFGDAIQFARYAPLVANCGGRVVVECHPPLVRLFQSLANVAAVIQFGAPAPAFDLHCPLLSLPRLFNTDSDSIPSRVPYLWPRQEDCAIWQERLAPFGGVRIGLAWAGKSYPDPLRSCPPLNLAPLAAPGRTFISLQLGARAEDTMPPGMPLIDLTASIRDFADTAALIHHLDLVITIDTAVAHLAGALGKPTLVLLPFAPDWRWLIGRTDCPWYPTMRLFRQTAPGDWQMPIRQAHDLLSSARFPAAP